VPIDEKHPLCGQSPYSATKIGADAIALSFRHSFALPVVVARPFNTYGPRQSARAVIPAIVSQIAAGHDEIHLGCLSATRDFTFVKDTCRALAAIGAMDHGAGEVFNIGSNAEISVGCLLAVIAELMESPARAAHDPERDRPVNSEVRRLWCDNRKLRQACGFEPQTTLRAGLAETIEWFRRPENLKSYKTCLYNV